MLKIPCMHCSSRAALNRPAPERQRIWRCFFNTSRCLSARGHRPGNPAIGSASNKIQSKPIPRQTSESPQHSPSLFRDLFPDIATTAGQNDHDPDNVATWLGTKTTETHHQERGTESGTRGAATRRGEPWRDTTISTHGLRSWLEAQANATEDVLPDKDQMPAMLVLTNASRSLVESDFHRIGTQGKHLQGWNGPIKQIVQAYDRNTLEPLGCYFVLFASKVAARTYQTEAERSHWPDAPAKHDISLPHYGLLASPAHSTSPASLFTLSSSPTAPLGLKLHSLPPSTAARLKAFTVDGILANAAPPKSDQSKITPAGNAEGDHRIIFALEGGALDLPSLLKIFQRDGEQRNLQWDITRVHPYLPPKLRGAIQRGARKQKSVQPSQNEASESPRGTEGASDPGAVAESTTKSRRFVVSFGDVHEARRFVRVWHRRELELPVPPNSANGASTLDTWHTLTTNVTTP